MDSIHGRALLKMGLIVAPSCNDCHGVHDIKRAVDRDSPINHANVAKTCGKCHVGIEEDLPTRASTASCWPRATSAARSAPIATPRTRSNGPERRISRAVSDERCGRCHEDRLEHYRDTYHGKAMALGKPNVAAERRRLLRLPRPPRRAAALRHPLAPVASQHPGHLPAMSPAATAKFTEYKPHANPLDGKNYPLAAPCLAP